MSQKPEPLGTVFVRPAGASWGKASSFRLCLATFGLLWLIFVAYHQSPLNSNDLSRLLLLRAATTMHTLQIDTWHEMTLNKAVFRGHYYSDKPPGGAMLALPGYSIGKALAGVWNSPSDERRLLVESWSSTAFSVAICGAFIPIVVVWRMVRFVGAPTAAATGLFFAFGTGVLPYGTSLFPHTASFILITLALGPFLKAGRPTDLDLFAGGAAAGLAVSCELTAGLAAALALLLSAAKFRRRVSRTLLGLFVGLAPFLLYSFVCFKNPFIPGYHYQAAMPAMRGATLGFHLPSFSAAAEMLVGPRRGLLLFSPFLLLSLFGLRGLWLSSRLYAVCALLGVAAQLLVISAYFDQEAGGVVLPRLLMPALPLLILPCAFGAARYPKASIALGVASIVAITLVTTAGLFGGLVAGEPPFHGYLRLLKAPNAPYSIAELLGASPLLGACIFFVVEAVFLWIAFGNLVELGSRRLAAVHADGTRPFLGQCPPAGLPEHHRL